MLRRFYVQEAFFMQKNKLINEFDELLKKLTAPSNRRSGSHNLGIGPKMTWSIDRITIVGQLREGILYNQDLRVYEVDFRNLMRLNEGTYVKPVGLDSWKIVDNFGENVCFIEILKFKKGWGRIDFNPNKITKLVADSMKTFIHKLFLNPHFSRADVACDVINIRDDFIRNYRIIEPITFRPIYGKSGNLETAYWGSRSSERQIRLYNKFIEQRSKGKIIPDEIETWWRFELQLRRAKSDKWSDLVLESLSQFNNPFFIKDLSNTESIMLDGLIANHGNWGKLSKNAKTKYKNLFNSANNNDVLTQLMEDKFVEQLTDLKNELDTWLRGYNVTNEVN